ncbi:hypothetical protein F4553_005080 [Allocatelliglobosispora scoriae]|uniref:Uncharacterized protein n=1 Tax=Allocatelliglobosispora scoriae TaxID=643052 RepID=A0A841BYF3_9ACTN|nr:hypothetical protein [Allocatelliglobosispora scoriae]MBB5871701.1 hypothetical protein [Allocatelliglobosispora scoriae]
MTDTILRTELAAVCAQLVINDAVAPRVHRVAGASAAVSPLMAAWSPMFGRVESLSTAEPRTQIEQGGYVSKPEFTTKKVDGLRGVPPRGRPV